VALLAGDDGGGEAGLYRFLVGFLGLLGGAWRLAVMLLILVVLRQVEPEASGKVMFGK
jgi:hypothetical protein